jgi:putative chitinase
MKNTTKLALLLAVAVFLVSRKLKASGSTMSITDDIIRQIEPKAKLGFAKPLAPAMIEGDIVTPPRIAAFLAQILHETGGFQWMKELASGQAYEGRQDLGNTQPGDGPRFKGRGFIQLTGRANYEKAGRSLGLDLVNNPELAAEPGVAARTAVWFWAQKNLNARADIGDFIGITRAINGGTRGLEDRLRLYEAAKAALGYGFSPLV